MDDVKKFRADYRHVAETEFDDAQYVGIADFYAQRLRADTAEACVEEWRRSNHGKTVLENLELREKLSAAEQRISELLALIEKAHTWVDRNNFGGWDAYELRDELAAALNPKPEAGSHE